MLDKICQLFFDKLQPDLSDPGRSSSNGRARPKDLNLDDLFGDLSILVTKNQAKLAENEDEIRRVEANCRREEKSLCDIDHDVLKRCALRHIKVLRKRIGNLSRISIIYNDNISMQTHMADRLENVRVSGLKTVTPDMLENITIDCNEMYQKHRDTIASVKALMDIDDTIPEDQELRNLAKELGVEL